MSEPQWIVTTNDTGIALVRSQARAALLVELRRRIEALREAEGPPLQPGAHHSLIDHAMRVRAWNRAIDQVLADLALLTSEDGT